VEADAAVAWEAGAALALPTADCLPVAFACPAPGAAPPVVALAHAGWRGLVAGVLANTAGALASRAGGRARLREARVWIGPSIGRRYEVGEDVMARIRACPGAQGGHFCALGGGQWLVDLLGVAESQLAWLGFDPARVAAWPGATLDDPRFHSLRRDGAASGRMATVVGAFRLGGGPAPGAPGATGLPPEGR
jgi:copper oxidase (laccase) domain-containing protein